MIDHIDTAVTNIKQICELLDIGTLDKKSKNRLIKA